MNLFRLTVNDKLRNYFRGDSDRVLTLGEEILAGMGTGVFQGKKKKKIKKKIKKKLKKKLN